MFNPSSICCVKVLWESAIVIFSISFLFLLQMRNWFANYSKPRDSAWGYAQWKPVMYTSTQRKNADLSHATSYPNLPVNQEDLTEHYLPDRSLFKAYFLKSFDEVNHNHFIVQKTSQCTTVHTYYTCTAGVVWYDWCVYMWSMSLVL